MPPWLPAQLWAALGLGKSWCQREQGSWIVCKVSKCSSCDTVAKTPMKREFASQVRADAPIQGEMFCTHG